MGYIGFIVTKRGNMQTLAELKAQNEKAEATEVEEATTDPQSVEEEAIEEPEVESATEEVEETEEVAEPTEEETTDTEVEGWMQGDDQTSDAEIPNSAWKAAREKYKAKLDKKEEDHKAEIDRLKAQLEQRTQGKPAELKKPKREDFYDADDQDEAYAEALVEYRLSKFKAEQDATQAATVTQQKQAQIQQRIESNVDQHYERAAKLAHEVGISDEAYRKADENIRMIAEQVFPKSGDRVIDGFISTIGEDSEKIFYGLGINETKKLKFKSLLESDRDGLTMGAAAAYLGSLKSEIGAPAKRTTKAPKPASKVNGDAKVSQGNFEKRYKAAKTPQAQFNIRREARRAGVDTKSW